jgi:hypothetical protein
VSALGFVIVGTPRSGTTLVQRLAAGLHGVRTPPETHFLDRRGLPVLRAGFPLEGAALRDELERFVTFQAGRGVDVDVDALQDAVGERASTLVALFAAIVTGMTGPAALVGEKTPEHLLWLPYLARALDQLKVVAVVRDPRAVVASNLAVPFGMDALELIAQRWQSDQRLLAGATATLGDRLLVLRYEEIVADPASATNELAALLGRPESGAPVDPSAFVAPTETWKERVAEPTTSERVDQWRDVLSDAEQRRVMAICGPWAHRFGYGDARRSVVASVALRPTIQLRRLRFLAVRRRRERAIRRHADRL